MNLPEESHDGLTICFQEDLKVVKHISGKLKLDFPPPPASPTITSGKIEKRSIILSKHKKTKVWVLETSKYIK